MDTEKEEFEAALREDLGDDSAAAYGDRDNDLGAWTTDTREGYENEDEELEHSSAQNRSSARRRRPPTS